MGEAAATTAATRACGGGPPPALPAAPAAPHDAPESPYPPTRPTDTGAQPLPSAGGEADDLVQQHAGPGLGRVQVRLDRLQAQAPVGDHEVELAHHLGLGHDRQARQVSYLEPVHVDPGQAAGMEAGV